MHFIYSARPVCLWNVYIRACVRVCVARYSSARRRRQCLRFPFIGFGVRCCILRSSGWTRVAAQVVANNPLCNRTLFSNRVVVCILIAGMMSHTRGKRARMLCVIFPQKRGGLKTKPIIIAAPRTCATKLLSKHPHMPPVIRYNP